MFNDNFCFKPISEEIILQPKIIFDQKILDENLWFKPIPEEMILQP